MREETFQVISIRSTLQAFHEPFEFVRELQHEPGWRAWLIPLSIAMCSYACFGLSAASFQGGLQLLSSPLLFPLLFLGALAIGVPALYIFHAFLGSQLPLRAFLAASLVALTIPGIMLAGFAPVNWFLSVSTRSFTIVYVSNVFAIGLAAFLGYNELTSLLQQLDSNAPAPQQSRQRLLLRLWMFLYAGLLYKLFGHLLGT